MPRLICARAGKHIQVLRLKPDDVVTLFDGLGGEYICKIKEMGCQKVQAQTIHAKMLKTST